MTLDRRSTVHRDAGCPQGQRSRAGLVGIFLDDTGSYMEAPGMEFQQQPSGTALGAAGVKMIGHQPPILPGRRHRALVENAFVQPGRPRNHGFPGKRFGESRRGQGEGFQHRVCELLRGRIFGNQPDARNLAGSSDCGGDDVSVRS